jgi:hypothetical protein
MRGILESAITKRGTYVPAVIVFLGIVFALSPAAFFEFGFHNDYWAWAYDTDVCCTGHPESAITIAIGRYLAAIMMNLQFMTIHHVSDLAFWRLIIVVTTGLLGVYYFAIVSIGEPAGWWRAWLTIAIFVLPTMQLNATWASNFVYFNPPLFLALLGSHAFLVACDSPSQKRAPVIGALGFGALIAALFFYPPSATFVLIPAVHLLLFGNSGRARAFAFYTAVTLCLAFLVYYLIQKVIVLPRIAELPALGDYRFAFHDRLFSRSFIRLLDHLYSASYLWVIFEIPAVPFIVGTIVLCCGGVLLLLRSLASRRDLTGLENLAIVLGLLVIASAPMVLAQKYSDSLRVLFSTTTIAVLVIFHLVSSLFDTRTARSIAALGFAFLGGVISFVSVYEVSRLSSLEHAAYGNALAGIPRNQFHSIAVLSPVNKQALGHELRADFGWVLPISTIGDLFIGQRYRGMADFDLVILKVQLDGRIPLILERSATVIDTFGVYGLPPLKLAERVAGSVASIPRSSSTGPMNAVDGLPYTFWEVWDRSFPISLELDFSFAREISGYRLTAGDAPERMPSSWELWGSNDIVTWRRLDAQVASQSWRRSQVRDYSLQAPVFIRRIRLAVTGSQANRGVRLYEFTLR